MNKYRFCPACGQQLLPNARFCHNCGHLINDLVEEQNEEVVQDTNDVQTVVFSKEAVMQENEEAFEEPKRKGLFGMFKAKKQDEFEEDYDEELEYDENDEYEEYEEYDDEYEEAPKKGLGIFEKILIFIIAILLIILIVLAVNLVFPDVLKPIKDLLPFNQKEKVVEPLKPEVKQSDNKKAEQPKNTTVSGTLGDYLKNNNLSASDITSLNITNNKVTLNNKEAYDLVGDLKFEDFSSLNNLSELTLTSTNLSNLSGIERFSNLNKLTLKDNNNLKDVNALISLNNLKDVILSNTPISDYRPLKNVNNVIFNETNSRVDGTRQIQVITKDLRRRKSPDSTSRDNIINGFVGEGYYFIFDEKNVDGITWYKINNGIWIASKEGEWTKLHN